MNDKPISVENNDLAFLAQDKIYIQASEWIRMVNTITWAMGTILVPTSAVCVGWAIQYPEYKEFFAIASVFLYSYWIYVSFLYSRSAAKTRNVLIEIETAWGVDDKFALYKMQGQVAKKWYSFRNTRLVSLLFLIVLWAVLLARLHSKNV
ncbi:MAG: hypothetical protein IPM55_18895 [Acidobacteria bacterium]|nr:hypothetical protein [Acidobacteriota bacterium]